MSLINGLSGFGSGLATFADNATKDEQAKASASLLNSAPSPVAPATPEPTPPAAPQAGPRMPSGPNPYGAGPNAQALWAAELAIKGPESGGKADAQNPVSSAGGLFQITNGTFTSALQKMGIEPPSSQAELNAMKYQPDLNTRVMRQINTEAAAALDAKGLPVTVQTLQAAHRLGPGGAAEVIQAALKDPNAPLMGNGLAPDAVKGNGDISHLTVGQFLVSPYPRATGS